MSVFTSGDETVALSFPGDVRMPFVAGTWSRRGRKIDAVFTPEQLRLCLDLAKPFTVAELARFRTRRLQVRQKVELEKHERKI